MKRTISLTTFLLTLATLSACQTTAIGTNSKIYGKDARDYQTAPVASCPKLVHMTREYRERLPVTPDMVVSWSNENSAGAPRILLILNEKGVTAYNNMNRNGLAPVLLIGEHTITPSTQPAITKGFLTLENLPTNWTEACTASLFSVS